MYMFDKDKNARDIMRQIISRDDVGRRLTPEARERAADFAARSWSGQMGSGYAAQIGIKHVTDGVFQ